MHLIRRNRLLTIFLLMTMLALGVFFALRALNDSLMYYYTPTDISNLSISPDVTFRLGGMVVNDSIIRSNDKMLVRFAVTDFKQQITVEYQGVLPDLFREGQGVVARGRFNQQGLFMAEEVLAKHDENYMPPNVTADIPAR